MTRSLATAPWGARFARASLRSSAAKRKGEADKESGKREVPKTLIFAKDDSHADDIVRIAREVFAEGNEFCQKITYRTGFTKITKTVKNDDGSESEATEWVKTSNLTPDEILANFRNSFFPRIAVTVDMISSPSSR